MDRIDPAEMAQLKEGLQQKVAGIVEAVLSLMSRCFSYHIVFYFYVSEVPYSIFNLSRYI